MSTPIVLSEQAKQFIAACHEGGDQCFAQDLSDQYPVTYWSRVGEPLRLPPNKHGAQIFFGVNPTTVRVTPEDRERYPGRPDSYIEPRVASKDRTVKCANFIFRDYDGKNFTYPTEAEVEVQYQILLADPSKARTPKAGLRRQAHGIAEEVKFKTNPNHYRALALAYVQGLVPQPSVAQASGGGYNCFWRFNKTFFINSAADLAYIKDLQKRWVAMDPCADQGVNDLRRIFRPVGTTNYKGLYAPNYPTVAFIKFDLGLRYSVEEIHSLLPALPVHNQVRNQWTPSHNQTKTSDTGTPYQGESVIGPFNAAHDIVKLATKYGYTHHYGDKWNPPGAKNHCVTMFTATNTMLSRSWNDPAYNDGHKIDCFCLYRIWEHGGDMKAAIEGARALLGMEKKSNQPDPSIQQWAHAIQQWIVTADFSQIIPKAMQSAKGYRTDATDKRALSAVVNILIGQYNKLSGPVSLFQGSEASGLTEGTFRNAMKRLAATKLLQRITPDDSIQDGAFCYELATLAYFEQLGVVIEAKASCSIYASVFDQEKIEDAWQRTGSKAQREKALIKSLGPDALLVVSALPVGERVHAAVVGEQVHKSASAMSRILKRLEDCGLVLLERIGRQQYITLREDWQEQLAFYTPYMTTAGNRKRREFGLYSRKVADIDRRLARKMGNVVRLLDQREKYMRRLTAIMESDMQGMDADLMAEKMRRLLRADSLRRNASAEKKTVQSLDVATHRNNQAKAPWLTKNSPAVERRTRELMQELEENEMLIEARAELRRAA